MAARRLAISSLLCEDGPSDAPVPGPSTPSLPFPSHPQSRLYESQPTASTSYSRSPEPSMRPVSRTLTPSPDATTSQDSPHSPSYSNAYQRRPPSPPSYPSLRSSPIPSQSHIRRYSYGSEHVPANESPRPGSQGSDHYTRRHQQATFEFPRPPSSRHQYTLTEPPSHTYVAYESTYSTARPSSSRSGASASPSTPFTYPPQSLQSPSITPSLSPGDTYHRHLSRSPILPIQRAPPSPVAPYNSQTSYIPPPTRSPYTLSPAYPTSHHPSASPSSPYVSASQQPQLSPVLARPSLSSLITHSPPLSRGSHSHATNVMSTPVSARAEGFGPLEALVQAATEERRRLSGELPPPSESRRHSRTSEGHASHKSSRVSPVVERRLEQPPQLVFQSSSAYPLSHSGQVSTSPVVSSTRLVHEDYSYPMSMSARVLDDEEPPLKRRRSSRESLSPVVPLHPPPAVLSHADFVKSLEKRRSSEHIAPPPLPINGDVRPQPSPSPSLPVPAMFPVSDTSRGVVIIKDRLDSPPVLRKKLVEKVTRPQSTDRMTEDLELKASVDEVSARMHAQQAQRVRERDEMERLERQRLEDERMMMERLERERLEIERLEKGRLEEKRLAQERLEEERLAQERLEADRLDKERHEQARLEREREEREREERESADKEREEKEKERAKAKEKREKAEARRKAEKEKAAVKLEKEKNTKEKVKSDGQPKAEKSEHRSDHRRVSTQEDPHEWLLEHYAPSPKDTHSQPPPSQPPSLPASDIAIELKRPTPIPVPWSSPLVEKDAPSSSSASPALKPSKSSKAKPPTSAPPAPVNEKKAGDKKLDRALPARSAIDADIDMELGLAADTSAEHTKRYFAPAKRELPDEMDVDNELLSLLDDEPRPKPQGRPRSPPVTLSKSPASPPVQPPVTQPSTQKPKASQKKALLDVDQKRATPTPSAASERGSMPPPSLSTKDDLASPSGSRDGSVAPGTSSGPPKKKEASAKPVAKPKTIPKPKGRIPAAKPKAGKATKEGAGASGGSSGSTLSPAVSASVMGKGSKKASPLATSVSKRAVSAATGASRSRSTSVAPVGMEAEKKAEEVAEVEEEAADDKLYCICKTTYDEDRVMIACDRCDEWYHTQCVGMSDTEVDLVDQFICPLCVEANPTLNLRTTYKQRCAAGLNHPHPSSPSACHKPSRGAFSKYCSQECGIAAMRFRIEQWGGDKERLWESVKDAQRPEGVVIRCTPGEAGNEVQELVRPLKSKAEREIERLNAQLDKVARQRDEVKVDSDILLWREKLVELATARAEREDECGWDQRLCFGDEEYAEFGPGVLESYEEENSNQEDGMQVDGVQEAGEWWCRGKKKCERHAGWQKLRQAEVQIERETIETLLTKLTSQEREIRKRIEDVQETKTAAPASVPLQPLNGKGIPNGVVKQKSQVDGLKKGKKRKEME